MQYHHTKRAKRVEQRADNARDLLKSALTWKTDDQAAYHLASVLVEGRDARLLAALWREVRYLDVRSPYGMRALKVVQQANDALAKDLVERARR